MAFIINRQDQWRIPEADALHCMYVVGKEGDPPIQYRKGLAMCLPVKTEDYRIDIVIRRGSFSVACAGFENICGCWLSQNKIRLILIENLDVNKLTPSRTGCFIRRREQEEAFKNAEHQD
jgi:hypothetical protein